MTLQQSTNIARCPYADAFTGSCASVIRSLTLTDPACARIVRFASESFAYDCISYFTLEGGVDGFIALGMDDDLARSVAAMATGRDVKEVAPNEGADTVNEILNMIAGNAKALLIGTPYHFSFGLPKVLGDAGIASVAESGDDGIHMQFTTPVGHFGLGVSIVPRKDD
jgi:CheY-specific phosphatase CheX